MRERRRIYSLRNRPAGVLFAVLLLAMPALALLLLPDSRRADGYAVVAGLFALGISLGCAYEIWLALQRRKRGLDIENVTTSESAPRVSGVWLGATAAGVALILRALIPDVFGWPLFVVSAPFVAGLLMPRMAIVFWLEFARARST